MAALHVLLDGAPARAGRGLAEALALSQVGPSSTLVLVVAM